ncbi:MAG: TIGR03435 family protein [Bryobacteraceae bacterium]|jgi:uncharacterized protein (TIGR03435 family)
MSATLKTVFIALASVAAWGQTGPAFEVASIKPSEQAPEQVNVGVHIDGAQLTALGLNLREYIRMAFRLKDYEVVGPDWLASQRFDVEAKLPAGATREDVPAMTLALLQERFGLKFHRDSKEFPVYGLVPAKGGLKLKAAPENPDDVAAAQKAVDISASGGRGGVSINLGNGAYFTFSNNQFTGRKLTMANLADSLGRFMDKPVVDMTKTPGRFDVTLPLSPQDFRIMLIRSAVAAGANVPPQALRFLNDPLGDSLALALDRSGLRLEDQKAPLQVLVVDHMEQQPTAN